MKKFRPLPPLEELQKVLSYDPETGIFVWRFSKGRQKAGSIAGTIASTGYRKICFERRIWLAHRLAWLFGTGKDPGKKTVDHINRNTDDNRLENLRLATLQQQQGNRGMRVDSKSGLRGVLWDKQRNKWVAKLQVAGCTRFLGHFALKEDAAAAYQKAAADYFGEFLAR
jgi:hypothetical protein